MKKSFTYRAPGGFGILIKIRHETAIFLAMIIIGDSLRFSSIREPVHYTDKFELL